MVETSIARLGEIANVLMDFSDMGYINLHPDYAGRGMYGRTCVGFTTDSALNFLLGLSIVLKDWEADNDHEFAEDLDVPTVEDLIGCVRQDSMGLSTIVYFPNWKATD